MYTKSQSQKIHAKKRAFERYGLMLNRADLMELVNKIHNNSATLLEKQSHRVRVFLVECKGIKVPVVYDNQRKTIVSFLPKEYLEEIRYTPEEL